MALSHNRDEVLSPSPTSLRLSAKHAGCLPPREAKPWLLLAVALVLGVCASCFSKPKSDQPLELSGVWAGDAGPDPSALKFQAKIEIQEDAGNISGEFFNEDPEKPGVYLRTGQIRGTRDGGTLLLTAGSFIETPDAGTLRPQQLTLSYDAGFLVGVRVLQLPGRPPVNEYLRLHRQ
ncbi:MAG: hypothetical protein ACLPJH_03415 [Myxococcaceae bacterium]